MLSYRHAFHAGNHADVLKHLVLVHILEYMNQKDTGYFYIDTHAGAGVYALDGKFASKSAEAETGITRLWGRTDLPAGVESYIQLIKSLNPDGKLRFYPGSPFCAHKMAREQDRLRLYELHPSDATFLQNNFRDESEHEKRGKRVLITKGDGFDGLKSLLPPPSRRGVVLIDPPYEVKDDYRRVAQAMDEALKRFATGVFAIWYPVLQRPESRQLPTKLQKLPAQRWLNVTLSIDGPVPDGFGLRSSGMFVVNPPWTLEPMLKAAMPFLVKALGISSQAEFSLNAFEEK